MSAVELAVIKVKKMSPRQARELLSWLDSRQAEKSALKPRRKKGRRKTTVSQRLKKLKAWEDSVRLTTDWEPPRMPDDLVKPYPL